jgi:hypothetical protein
MGAHIAATSTKERVQETVLTTGEIHECECRNCQEREEHPEQALHRHMNVFVSRLNEQQRRWYVALESHKVGHGGDQQLSLITGMNVETIRRGRRELEESLAERPTDRVRLPGGGRPSVKEKTPG